MERNLFASGFNCGSAGQIGWEFVGFEGLDVELHQTHKRRAEVGQSSTATVDEGCDGDDVATSGADDVEGFLDSSAAGHDVLDDEEFVAGMDFKSSPEDEFALFFFGEDVREAEVARDFVTDDEAAESRGDDTVGSEAGEFCGELGADFSGDLGVLEQESTLEELPAVQAGSEKEMAFEKGSGLFEEFQWIGHGLSF